ncbi:hypothetical protein LINPERPRIM_LOCUS30210 [Linum perenne]
MHMNVTSRHASGLWVCSWIKNECRFPFHDYGPFRLLDRKELVVELVMKLTNFARKNLLTRMMKHKGCQRARRHLNYNR